MTAFYGNFDRDAQEAESLKTIATALELGINLLDTAWIYQVCCIGDAAFSKLLIIYFAPRLHSVRALMEPRSITTRS
jgi:predicted oxidoreductase